MDEEAQDNECPVCYESLSDSARTLSCRHQFCHDCLVRTLVNTSPSGPIKRDNIICPVCRHLTFIKKLHEFTVSSVEAKKTGKTLEVSSEPTPVFPAGGSHRRSLTCIFRCLRRISCRLCRRRLICPRDNSEVFIISEFGRPMAEEDVINIGTNSAMQRNYNSNGCRFCTISCCLLVLMITFTLLALVAATLPWVLLA
ncbi:RING finger protein 222 [Xyrauchen texanus]|uniref:RING finger protein 222 n=1 Tax=Xyrauchen texanus TaxID=154827 RepID=UPI002242477C|nr:RING finger protein 222 [Xyrauchen texanus]